MITVENRRIAKNTIFLYGRVFLSAWISLYTSRIVLERLGESNFGIFSLIGGFVMIFTFLNASASTATMRFLNFEMGRGDATQLKRTFGNSLTIHISIAALAVILAETIGLWAVNNWLNIAPDRITAANWCYQATILIAVISIVQIPFTAAIMAHEKMNVYALVALIYVILRLLIVFALELFPSTDNLITYSILYFLSALTVGLIYFIYAVRKFNECQTSPVIDRATARDLLTFSGWDIYNVVGNTTRIQGTTIILNKFGGAILNAAAGLAAQVSMTLLGFATSLISAFRPQITQQYAKQNYSESASMVINASRFSFLMMGLFVIPIFTDIDYILRLWLAEVPEYTGAFCRICLLSACGDLINTAVCAGIHATGRIRSVSIASGTLYLFEVPAMYILLMLTRIPEFVYIVHLIIIFVIIFINSLILHRQMTAFEVGRFWKRCIAAPLFLLGTDMAVCFAINAAVGESFARLIVLVCVSTAILSVMTYLVILDCNLRREVRTYIRHKTINIFRHTI